MKHCLAAILVMTALGTGCSENAGGDGDGRADCTYELEWGYRDGDTFSLFDDGMNAEITIGYQGFRFIDSTVRLRGVNAEMVQCSFDIDIDGYDPYSQNGAPLYTTADSGGVYVDHVLVFFNEIATEDLVGRSVRIDARVTADGCVGTSQVELTLVDEDECLHLPDGGLDCVGHH